MEEGSTIREEEDWILAKFSPKFKEKIHLNPMYRMIYELLCAGVNEYSIIERLLEANEDWAITITKLQEENVRLQEGTRT